MTARALPHFAAPRGKSSSDEWYTPDSFVQALGPFDLDPCTHAQRGTQLAPKFYTLEDNGLAQPWAGRVWCNPPFSDIKPWVARMREHNDGVLLCFSRTDALWFVDLARHCGALFLIARRLQFHRPGVNHLRQRCPMGTVLFPFGDRNIQAIANSGIDGLMMRSLA